MTTRQLSALRVVGSVTIGPATPGDLHAILSTWLTRARGLGWRFCFAYGRQRTIQSRGEMLTVGGAQ